MPGVTFFCVFLRPETNRHHPLCRTRVKGNTLLFISKDWSNRRCTFKPPKELFYCGDGVCIDITEECDSYINCPNGQDEDDGKCTDGQFEGMY